MKNTILNIMLYIYIMQLAEGTFSTIYSAPNRTVIKRYKVDQALYREIRIMELCKNTKYILQPIAKETGQIILPLMSPLTNLDISCIRVKDRHKIIRSLIDGLKELHDLHIIHHDIKLDNILYDPLNLTIKIADFSSSFTIDEFGQLDNKQKKLINNTTSPLHRFYRKIIDEYDLYASDKWSMVITILQFYKVDIQYIRRPDNVLILFKKLRHKYPADTMIINELINSM